MGADVYATRWVQMELLTDGRRVVPIGQTSRAERRKDIPRWFC